MRFRPSAIGLVVLTAAAAVPARAQFSFDARRIGMAGVSLHRDGDLQRYNAAYRAAPKGKNDQGGLTIPIPLGILQAIKDSNITFDTKDSNFNVIAIANLILNPPIFYQIKKPPTPTNDIAIGVGKDSLSIDLGLAKALIPQDRFAFGGSSRLMDIGFGIKGVRLSVFAFIEEDIGADLNDNLRGFLKGDTAADNTTYAVLPSGRAQAGFAPSLGWAGKIAGPDPDHGLYLGGNVHRYFGVAYAEGGGNVGFHTGTPIFSDTGPASPVGDVVYRFTNHPGKKFATGTGGDVGVVVIQGPIEFGLGVNDIGATLTWPQTEIDSVAYDPVTNKFVKTVLDSMAQSKSKLPVSYLGNVTYHTGDITFGANILNSGRGTTVHVGAEKRFGPLALRGGVARDRRKQIQFGWGGGVRLGFLGLDVGFATTSQNLSSERGIVMATSLTIY